MKRILKLITCVLPIFLLSTPARATLFQVNFHTEMTRAFTVGTDEFFDRTSATSQFVFDAGAAGHEVLPEGAPIIHFNNERFLNGIDISDSIVANNGPSMGPTDWIASWDNFHVEISDGVITNFSLHSLKSGNEGLFSDYFDNPTFDVFVNGPRELAEFSIYDANSRASWDLWSGGTHQSIVNWSYAEVSAPNTIWMIVLGLIAITANRLYISVKSIYIPFRKIVGSVRSA